MASRSASTKASGPARFHVSTFLSRSFLCHHQLTSQFDSLETSQKTGLGPAPTSPLHFSAQWSVFNVTRGDELGVVPPSNLHSAVSAPNAMIASRFNPGTKQVGSVPTISRPDDETFDLFGFYVQPMELPPGVKGVNVYITAKGDEEFDFAITLLPGMQEPWYFEAHTLTHKKWDGLSQVKVWAELSGMEETVDWELFVDDLWVRYATLGLFFCVKTDCG
jgi:hypothetical protein